MAHGAEDCATVLEQFVHDVANLPAEITHLMEEIQAKDKTIQECRSTINSRDSSLQKFIKLNGSHAPNPKEEQYGKTILQNFDKAQQLQDEKIQLSEKACVLLDRQIKKLDIKIRDLQNEGVLSSDPPIPSLFRNKDQYRELPKAFFPDPTPSESTSYSSPLNPTSGNANTPVSAVQRPNPISRTASATALAVQGGGRSSAPATPAATAVHLQQRQRESSAGAADSKRRRLNASLGSLPVASSNLRQSSLGPGTPKAGTPGSTRAGSAGPRTAAVTKKAVTKKVAPHQQVKKIKASSLHGKPIKRSSSVSGRIKLASGGLKKSPSGGDEEDEDSILSSADGSDSETGSVTRVRVMGSDEEMEDEEEDEGAEDSKVYCTCRSVSHGDMVACDNDSCPYEWFHWKCVGLTREPLGTWYCDECRKTLGK
ncbi:PHD finger domain protein [Paecilomyces variotii No. 5]|uniref:Chromatin modification-related protein n=1 Tax=Byssochlamys spectabilis (strain No. 5 / NBRC 109023) TaxID=1356009 RepID=V5FFC4_BYSSN|nr:PHD finger domain protein [Paecilomyces variotii No. 5]